MADTDACVSQPVPSIVKAHLCWTWQCTTLNRGDELVNLPLSFLQPYKLFVPDYTTVDGRRCGSGQFYFGILSLYHETKVAKPGVSSLPVLYICGLSVTYTGGLVEAGA
jgi:hypothetical protein